MAPLADTLKLLGLHHTAAHLDDLVALATKRRWSPTQLLEHLVDVEQQERARRSLERRLLRSRLGRFTPSTPSWLCCRSPIWPSRLDRIDAAPDGQRQCSAGNPASPSLGGCAPTRGITQCARQHQDSGTSKGASTEPGRLQRGTGILTRGQQG
jgi:hypothetical protein